jgi:sugar/nucleoside kinase (ribokinase family)
VSSTIHDQCFTVHGLMEPTYVIAGRMAREYVLPPVGHPLLDVAGGNALYAAGGLLPWADNVGLVVRVGEDFPRAWFRDIQGRGVDTQGVEVLPQSLDLRAFYAYNEQFEVTHGLPVSQFARRGLTFPKVLLGYEDPSRAEKDARNRDDASPLAAAIPVSYRDARAVHLCPLDFASHTQISSVFATGSVATLTLDPSAGYMRPAFLRDLRVVVNRLTAFLPSEEELRGLFWGMTYDLWEMAEAIGEYGCELVIIKRGVRGQYVYDVKAKRRWTVPAYPARPADPTGVGDAFCGGFLAGWRKTYDPVLAALHGNVSASLKLEGSGAFYPLDVLPGLAEARLEALKDLVQES